MLNLRSCGIFVRCAAATLLPAAGYSQQGDTPPSGVSSESTTLAEIIVTAQRRAERLHDVPLTITAQTAEDLQRAGISNTRELSIAVPGLSFTTQGAWAEPNIRGVHTTSSAAGSDSPIAIYVDGFYLSNQVGNVFDLPDMTRVEVLKGPQGTLFGRNATGGAISIHTLEPTFAPTGHITVSDGMFFDSDIEKANEYSVKGYLSGPLIADKVAGSLSGYYSSSDGYLANDRGGAYGDVESFLTRGKLLFTPTDKLRFLLAGSYAERDDDLGSSLTPLRGLSVGSLYPGGVVPNQPWHTAGEMGGGTHVDTQTASVTLRSELSFAGGTLTSLTGYNEVKATLLVDVDASYSPNCLAVSACITPYAIEYPSESVQQEFSFASEEFGAFSFVLGAFYIHDRYNFETNVNPQFTPPDHVNNSVPGVFANTARVKTEAYAGFGELNWNATDRLKAIVGIRYSWEEKSGEGSYFFAPLQPFPPGDKPQWDSWTPRVSLRYDLSDTANLYATYSEGFKSGVLDPTSFTAPAADPEEIKSYEIGTKLGTPDYNLNIAAFYYDYADLQVQFFNGVTTQTVNAANAEIYGLDVDGTVRLTDNLDLRVAASWVPKAEFTDFAGATDYVEPLGPYGLQSTVVDASGLRLLKTPKLTASTTLSYLRQISLGELEISGTAYYSDEFKWDVLGRVQTDSYVLLNGQVALSPANSHFRMALWGKNLGNKAYVSGAVLSAAADAVLYGPPRQVGVSLDYSF